MGCNIIHKMEILRQSFRIFNVLDAKRTLGIKLPFLVMIIKNLKKYFTFEVQVLDDKVNGTYPCR